LGDPSTNGGSRGRPHPCKGSVQDHALSRRGPTEVYDAYYHLPREARQGQTQWKRRGQGLGGRSRRGSEVTAASRTGVSAQRDNDVLVQAARDEHGGSYKKRTLEETLESDPQLAVGLLIVQAKLIEADAPVMN
jgi:hypothetical protein